MDAAATVELSPRRGVRRVLATLAVAAAIAVPSTTLGIIQVFSDVPPSSSYYTNILNLAYSGVTAGCGGGNYCPTDPVTREQMAAFLNRGLGRVAYQYMSGTLPTTETPAFATFPIQTGIPGSAISGASQFIKADTEVTIQLTDATSCPCQFRGAMYVTGSGYLQKYYADVTLTTVGEKKVLSMTGVRAVTSGAQQTIEVRIFRSTGSGSATAYGQATAEVFPFGSTGGVTLAPASAPGDAAAGALTMP